MGNNEENKFLEEKKELWLSELKKRLPLEKCQSVVETNFWLDTNDVDKDKLEEVQQEAKNLQYILTAIEAYTQRYANVDTMEYLLSDIVRAFRSPFNAHETQFVSKSLINEAFKDIQEYLMQLDHRILNVTADSIEYFNKIQILMPLNAKRLEDEREGFPDKTQQTPDFMQKIWARRVRILAGPYGVGRLVKKADIEKSDKVKQEKILSNFLTELGKFLSEVYFENTIDRQMLLKIIDKDQDDPIIFSFYLRHSTAAALMNELNQQVKKQLRNQIDEMGKISEGFFGTPIYLTKAIGRRITDYKNLLKERKTGLFSWRNTENINKTIPLVDQFCEKLLSEEGWLSHEIGDLIEELEASLPKEKGIIGNSEGYVFEDLSGFINEIRLFFLGQIFFQASPTFYRTGMCDGVAEKHWPHEIKIKYEKVVRNAITALVDSGVQNPSEDDLRGKIGRAFHSDYMISILNEWKEEQTILEAYDALLAKGIEKPTPLDVAKHLGMWNVYIWGVAESLIVKVVEEKEKEVKDIDEKKINIESNLGPKICIADEFLRQRVAQRVDELSIYNTHKGLPEYDEKKEIAHENELVHTEEEARKRKYDYFKLIHEKDKAGELTYDDVVKFGTRCCVNYIWGRRDGWFFKTSSTKQMDGEIRNNLIDIFEKLSGLYGEEERIKACREQEKEREKRSASVYS